MVSIGPLEQSFAYKAGEGESFELIEAEKQKKLSSEVEEWLDDQPDGSVLYISFGTIFTLQAEQLLEVAHGLEASGQRFLWIIRLPNVPHIMVSKQPTKEEISAILPPGETSFLKSSHALVFPSVPGVSPCQIFNERTNLRNPSLLKTQSTSS